MLTVCFFFLTTQNKHVIYEIIIHSLKMQVWFPRPVHLSKLLSSSVDNFTCTLLFLCIGLSFLAHLAEGHLNYCHYLVSVIVCSRLHCHPLTIFQKSSHLKLLSEIYETLQRCSVRVLCTKVVFRFSICPKTWLPLLKLNIWVRQ